MQLNRLTAICPLDGRYRDKLEGLDEYFSEFGLIKYRVKIEVLYLFKLVKELKIKGLTVKKKKQLVRLYQNFNQNQAEKVKQIEAKINHDVKAIEYLIKQVLGKGQLSEWVHFGLTSEDVNNLAMSLMIKDGLEQIYLPALNQLVNRLTGLSRQYQGLVMLARTHGQAALPTTLGKEIAVYAYRLKRLITKMPKLGGKLNGAVGNFNGLELALPQVNWIKFSQEFVTGLGLEPTVLTTQVEGHDSWAELFNLMRRINWIILGLDQDMWLYISQDYLTQAVIKGEVGSSTMPHKVNPIDFENSEGNVVVANSLLGSLADKLTVSRLQRDLSGSTASRNIGMGFGYSLLAVISCLKGLNKIEANQDRISQDLASHPEVLAEAIQLILRREGVKMPYEQLKQLTRGRQVGLEELNKFVDKLKISDQIKKELKQLRPEKYIGLAAKLAREI